MRGALPALVLLVLLLTAACQPAPNPAETAAVAVAASPTTVATSSPEPTRAPVTEASPMAGAAVPSRSGSRATGEMTAPLDAPPAAKVPTPIPDVHEYFPQPAAPAEAEAANAAARPLVRTIAIDPGHGGVESGAVTGNLTEAEINLGIARYLAEMLQDSGFHAVLTRDHDGPVSPAYQDPTVRGQLTQDLQARVDIANAAGADLFISIHNNGSGDSGVRGTEVWFNNARPYADRNRALATLVLNNTLTKLREAGHPTVNRGIQDDAHFRVRNGRSINIYVLGPSTTRTPTQMPAVLGESLFVSNPTDAAALRRPAIQRVIAEGYHAAVIDYFERFPD